MKSAVLLFANHPLPVLTPEALASGQPDPLALALLKDTLRTLAMLQARSDLTDVSLYGDAIHALLQTGGREDLESALAAAGITGATVEAIAPSLEDVFISLMKRP